MNVAPSSVMIFISDMSVTCTWVSKRKNRNKTRMSLNDPLVDDNVDVQLLLNCKDPATDFAVSRSPLCATPLT